MYSKTPDPGSQRTYPGSLALWRWPTLIQCSFYIHIRLQPLCPASLLHTRLPFLGLCRDRRADKANTSSCEADTSPQTSKITPREAKLDWEDRRSSLEGSCSERELDSKIFQEDYSRVPHEGAITCYNPGSVAIAKLALTASVRLGVGRCGTYAA